MAPGPRLLVRAALLPLLVAATACVSAGSGGARAGLLVHGTKPSGPADQAGIKAGDVLLSWRRGAAGGELRSTFDIEQLRAEESPRGVVTFVGRRGEEPVAFELADGSWGLQVWPRLGEERDQMLAAALATKGPEGAEQLQMLAEGERRPPVRAWLLTLAAKAAGVDKGEALWVEAAAVDGLDQATRSWVHSGHGEALEAASRLAEAKAVYALALECQPEGSLSAATSLSNLFRVTSQLADLGAAEAFSQQALEIRERLVPGTLPVAWSLENLGIVFWQRGELSQALGYFERVLEIREHLAPGSLNLAGSLNNLGAVATDCGDLEAAERYFRRALELFERLAPGSLRVATALSNLGNITFDRGNLDAAESLLRRALKIQQKVEPDGERVARSLYSLGLVAMLRDDLDAAESSVRRALEIKERLGLGELKLANDLTVLGDIAVNRGELETAESYWQRALDIHERLAPDGRLPAAELTNLGLLERRRGDFAAAEALLRRALEINERFAPDSLDVAMSRHELGCLLRERGDLAGAEALIHQGLEIRRRRAPGTTAEAKSLQELAVVLRATGRRGEALATLREAVRAVEAQQQRLGGTAEQIGEFRKQFLVIYRDLVDLLLEAGSPEEAFGVVERARARALLAMLAERDLVTRDLPAELQRERAMANADHDRAMAALGEAGDEAARVRVLAELETIGRRQDDIRARVRAASPRLAELRYPEPLDLAGARQALDPGSVLLEFAFGESTGNLFVVGPGADRFAVYPLAVGENALREEVVRLRRLLEPQAVSGQASRAALSEVVRSLSATLLAPAAEAIQASERVIVVPDGPLHLLPFAALLDPAEGFQRYLVESKPISVVASATVLAQLRSRPRSVRGAAQLVAFGDPDYRTAEAIGELRAATRGRALEPLPATRLEVEALGRLYDTGATVWLGADATEERAKTVGENATVVHFAAHGLLDERRPLSSALVLSIPEEGEERENGLLQAWEILEQVRLDADLVVLSACETALGKEVAGEGILGLTRAFQYAGARSVLASLWSVADESTAELMRRFYANLQSGTDKDEALRQAQLAFIRGEVGQSDGDAAGTRDLSHPFFWAAFQLYGDSR